VVGNSELRIPNSEFKIHMTRLACLLVPLFPLAARLRAEPELAGEEVVVCEGNGAAARVVGASRPARRAGVRPGMSLAQARGLLPALIARGRDPACEASAHEALLEAASVLSPQVEDAAPGCAFADLGGMERLYGGPTGEHDMGQAAITAAAALGLPVRAGIAGTKLAARLAARLPDTPRVVPAGGEAVFLAPLPLGALALDQRLEGTLRRWGVSSLGDLARLPADRTASRLGLAGAAAHRAARGLDASPLVPHHPPPVFQEGMELEWPVVTVEPLLYALRQSLARTHTRLEREDRAWTLLELELGLEPEGAEHRRIRLPAPTRDLDALSALIRLELEARPPRAPVVSFITLSHPDRPRRGQLSLFGAPEIHPDALAATLARLAARLGPDRVGSPRTVDGYLPERLELAPFDPPPPPKLRRPPRQGRGLLAVRVLRPPVALEVITEENSEFGIRNSESPSTPPERDFEFRVSNFELPPSHPGRSSEFGIRNSEFPPTPTEDATASRYTAPESDLSVRDGSREETQNSGAPTGGWGSIPHSSFLIPHSIRLLSVASAPGATPRIQDLVRVAAGPWTLEDGWWGEQPVERDYWDLELSGGGLYRIYRDRTTGEWFADGMYD
jgi:protein ImuB